LRETEKILELKMALTALPGVIVPIDLQPEPTHCDLVAQASNALIFFRMVETPTELRPVWIEAQKEVGEILTRRRQESHTPQFACLTLLHEGGTLSNNRVAQDIVSNEYVCRKFIFDISQQEAAELLGMLPFLPLPPTASPRSLPTSVAYQMGLFGYDQEWTSSLFVSSPARIVSLLREQDDLHIPRQDLSTMTPTDAENATGIPLEPGRHLKSLELQSFRGYNKKRTFDLDARLVVVYGRNGTGKTSLCDAIQWLITGQLSRFRAGSPDSSAEAPHPIVNVNSEGCPTVQATVAVGPAHDMQIIRTGDADGATSLTIDGQSGFRQAEGIKQILNARVPPHLRPERLRDLFKQYHLLEQHASRCFIENMLPNERYEALSYMVGTHDFAVAQSKVERVIGELDRQVEESRSDIDKLRTELDALSSQRLEQERELERWLIQTAGESPDDMVMALKELSLEAELTIDIPDAVPGEHMEELAEMVGSQLQPALRRAVEQAQALARLREQIATAQEAQPTIDRYRQQLLALDKEKKKLVNSLHTHESRVQELTDAIERSSSARDAIKEKGEHIRKHLGFMKTKEDFEEELVRISVRLEQVDQEMRSTKARSSDLEENLEETEAQYLAARNASSQAEALLARLRQAQSAWAKLRPTKQSLVNEEENKNRLKDNLTRAEKVAGATRSQVAEVSEHLNELERQMSALQTVLDDKKSLVMRLRGFVDGRSCPFCAHEFESRDELVEAVDQVLSSAPAELLAVQEQTQTLRKRKDEVSGKLRGSERAQQEATVLLNESTWRITELKQRLANLEEIIERVEPDLAGQCIESDSEWEQWVDEQRRKLADRRRQADEMRRLSKEFASQQNQQRALLAGLAEEQVQLEHREDYLKSEIASLTAALDSGGYRTQTPADLARQIHHNMEEADEIESKIEDLQGQLRAVNSDIFVMKYRLEVIELQEEQATQLIEKLESNRRGLEDELVQHGLDPNCDVAGLDSEQEKVQTQIAATKQLEVVCDRLRAHAAVKKAGGGMLELEEKMRELSRTVREGEKAAISLALLHKECQQYLDSLKTQRAECENECLNLYRPLTNALFYRLASRPYLGDLNISVDRSAQEVKVQLDYGDLSLAAEHYLSTAQLNTIAMCLFLSGAISQRWSGLDTIIIDDPVQNMDDLNAYAFLDLIHGLVEYLDKQIIITTSSRNLYELSVQRFADLNWGESRGFSAIRLSGFSESGPQVEIDIQAASRR